MNKSQSIKELATALAKFQSEIQNPKNTADNPFFKSKYAPLNDVLNLVRPALSKHGLSILQSPSGDGEKIIVNTILMHVSGEWIESEPLILKAEKVTAQGAGSAITYARRYALSSILGISSEDDDDGNHATGNKDTGAKEEPKADEKPICQDCGKEITPTTKKTVAEILEGSKKYYKKELCQACVSKRYREEHPAS